MGRSNPSVSSSRFLGGRGEKKRESSIIGGLMVRTRGYADPRRGIDLEHAQKGCGAGVAFTCGLGSESKAQ